VKKIIHISDVHFGAENKKIVNSLIADINSIEPDVIVLSGDLTQRAKTGEYKKAVAFLQKLNYPTVVIPGNHDIPLYNIWDRVISPFKKFETYFNNRDRYYSDDLIEVIGLNSVRNLRWKSGKLSSEDLDQAANELKESGKKRVRVLVIHHNLFHISSRKDAVKLFKTQLIHRWLMQNSIDLILFGHDHKSMVQPILFDEDNIFDFILVQAGTAVSTRTRGYLNSFNLIEISDEGCEIKIKEYKNKTFETVTTHQFAKVSGGWTNS
jgi:3',5'-cyclic AMP phosphodiesterase CpdA